MTFLPANDATGHSFLPGTIEALANLARITNFRGPRAPLNPRALSRSSLGRIEPTRKILGYFRVPRTAGTLNYFEVLAKLRTLLNLCGKKTKKISSFNCQHIVVTKKWSRANLVELKLCTAVWRKQHKNYYERHLFVPTYIPLLKTTAYRQTKHHTHHQNHKKHIVHKLVHFLYIF